jgi:hypothetical protein
MRAGLVYIVLASVVPFANFAAINVGEDYSHERLLLYAAATAACGLLLAAFAKALCRLTGDRAVFTLSALVLLFFAFDITRRVTGASGTVLLMVYPTVTALICASVAWLARYEVFRRFWLLMLVLLLTFSVANFTRRSLALQPFEQVPNSVRLDYQTVGMTSAVLSADADQAKIDDGASILGAQIARQRPDTLLQGRVVANAYSSQGTTAVVAVFRAGLARPVALESKHIAAGDRATFDLAFTVDAERGVPVSFDVRIGTAAGGSVTINGPSLWALPFGVPKPYILVSESEQHLGPTAENAKRRNVYYLTLDAYPRADVLKQLLGLDNSAFVSALEERGFLVARNSFANYFGTDLSVPGTMEQQFVVDETDENFWIKIPALLAIINGRNPVFQHFQKLGYYVGKLNFLEDCPADAFVDYCYKKKDHINRWASIGIFDLELSLMQLTPLYTLLQLADPDFLKSRVIVEDITDVRRLIEFTRQHNPRFIYAHIFLPHLPYRFNADCSWASKIVVDGTSTRKPDFERFLAQVQCANRQVIPLMDEILKSDPDSIILINSDHGSGLTVDWSLPYNQWPESAIRDRLGNLDAMRLPEPCRPMFYDGISPVNYFELVFACIEEREPHFLEDRIYISTFDKSHPHYGQVWRYR